LKTKAPAGCQRAIYSLASYRLIALAAQKPRPRIRWIQTRPQLRVLDLANHPDPSFRNGALAKAKTIMRNKIQALMEGREPVDEDYTKITE
jgi:hypothetical protein